MRVATARVASRRGSSMMIFPPRNHDSPSSAIGTTVLLPAPGGASTTALRLRCRTERNSGRISSMGRPDFTRPAILTGEPSANIGVMRWRQSRASQNVQDYRGRPTGGGGGLKLGLGTIVLGVIAYFVGGPQLVMSLFSGAGSSPQPEDNIHAGTPGDEGGAFVAHVLGDTEETWSSIFSQAGRQYPAPYLALFSQGINTACGQATSAAGPFYCPGDQKVYIDLAFFRQLETEFAAQGDFAKAYVIAHEVGHHVQTVLGTSAQVREEQQRAGSQERANQWQVRMELQADCFAGIWAHYADSSRQLVEQGDIDEALNAASAVGDDTIQKRIQGNVNQESFTHGSGEQRQQWFRKGYATGSVDACNTFQ